MKLISSALLALIYLTVVKGSNIPQNVDNYSEEDASDITMQNRIFGGSPANRNEYSYVARLQIIFQRRIIKICSGVVLNTKTIITVAHCLIQPGGERAQRVIARLPIGGTYNFRSNEILVHPLYSELYGADVALLRRNTVAANYMRNFGTPPVIPPQPVSPTEPDLSTGQLTAVGWGITRDDSFYPNRPQFAGVALMNTAACTLTYPSLFASVNEDEIVCTTISGLCGGDWGGPLLLKQGNNLLLRGLNMYRQGDCSQGVDRPNAYFNVAVVSNWISSNLF